MAQARELRVCADPNNLPFSNHAREGFENRIVDLIADDLHATVSYVWSAHRRGFIRNTLKAGLCDLIPGVASGMVMLRTTAPYYRSSYMFVTRPDGPVVASFDDPVLHEVRIGVQLVGDDGANTPPAHALTRRGLVNNVRGFTLYGDYGSPNPTAQIIKAVEQRDVDVAIAWGPLAGYFAQADQTRLRLTPVQPQIDGPTSPMAFDISMGLRKDDEDLAQEIEAALERRKPQIDAVLAEYGVPRADREPIEPKVDR